MFEALRVILNNRDIEGLKTLVTASNCHQREPGTYQHVFEVVLKSNWEEAVDYLLFLDKRLVNIGHIFKILSNKLAVKPLIVSIFDTNVSPSVIKKLMTDDLDLESRDGGYRTIFHNLPSTHQFKNPKYSEVIDQLIRIAPESVWDQRDGGDDTPHMLSTRFPKQKMQQPKESLELLDADINERKATLDYKYRLDLPILNPFDQMLSLIGKQIKRGTSNPYAPKIFFNLEMMGDYLKIFFKNNTGEVYLNAVVFLTGGVHALNIVFRRKTARDPLYVLYLDPAQQPDEVSTLETMLSTLQYSHIRSTYNIFMLSDKLQHSYTGCQIISSYLAGRFSKHEIVDQLDGFFRDTPKKGSVIRCGLHDFPANFGLLLITQSLRQIKYALESFDQATRDVEQEYPDYKTKSKKGMRNEYDQEWLDLDTINAPQNKTLERKAKNQLKHAKLALELDLIPHLSRLMGISEFYPKNQEAVVRGFLTRYRDPDSWDECYALKDFAELLPEEREKREESIAKKQKMDN